MRGLTPQRVVVLVVIAAAIASFLLFDLDRFLTVDWLKAQHAAVIAYRDARPLLAGVAFAGFYVVVTGLSLPGTIALALAGGAIFGLLWGTVLVSIAGSVGATVALLSARFLFRDAVEARFPQWFRRIALPLLGKYLLDINRARRLRPSPPR